MAEIKKEVNNYFYSFSFGISGSARELRSKFELGCENFPNCRSSNEDLADSETSKIALIYSMDSNDWFEGKNFFYLKFLRWQFNLRPNLVDKDYDFTSVLEDADVWDVNPKTPTQIEELYSYSLMKLYIDNERQSINWFISHERVTNGITKSQLTILVREALSDAFELPDLRNSLAFELKPVYSSIRLADLQDDITEITYVERLGELDLASRLQRQVDWVGNDRFIELKTRCTTKKDTDLLFWIIKDSVQSLTELPVMKFEIKTKHWTLKQDSFYLCKIFQVKLLNWNLTFESKNEFIRGLAFFIQNSIYEPTA